MRFVTSVERKDGDMVTGEFETVDGAMVNLNQYWNHLTTGEQKKVVSAFVLESNDPDENSEKHFDGTPVYVIV